MTHVLVQDNACVPFVVDQHPVGAFGTDAADKSFRVAVCPGTTGRAFNDVNTLGSEHGAPPIPRRHTHQTGAPKPPEPLLHYPRNDRFITRGTDAPLRPEGAQTKHSCVIGKAYVLREPF